MSGRDGTDSPPPPPPDSLERQWSMATNTAYGRFMRTNPSVEAQRQAAAHLSNAQSLPTEEKDRVKALVADGKIAEIGRSLLRTEWRNSPQPTSPTAAQDGEDEDEALAAALAMSMQGVADPAPGPSTIFASVEAASAASSAHATAPAPMGAAEVEHGAAPAAEGVPEPEKAKKKKKKRKKKGGYGDLMAGIMAPAALQRTLSAEKRDQLSKIEKSLGGGTFSKLDRI